MTWTICDTNASQRRIASSVRVASSIALIAILMLQSSLECFATPDERIVLKVGDKAPMFTGIDHNGKKWNAKDKAGKKVCILYFYPADMTGGCTKQACTYRDAVKNMKRDDVEVVGVSGDSIKNHRYFRNEYKLNFTLLADADGKIAEAFGVTIGKGGSFLKRIDGREVSFDRDISVHRWTFIIDKDWKIMHKDTKVNAEQDSAKVLAVINRLSRKSPK